MRDAGGESVVKDTEAIEVYFKTVLVRLDMSEGKVCTVHTLPFLEIYTRCLLKLKGKFPGFSIRW
jgi:hypothetical protein